jgi:endo-alpha-1,4-polygalactosaminidase (GH114 family)
MQLESRRKFSQIYDKLSDATRAGIDKQVFVDNYQPLFDQSNTANQELSLGKIFEISDWVSEDAQRAYPQVVQMEMLSSTQAKNYLFAFENGVWALIK